MRVSNSGPYFSSNRGITADCLEAQGHISRDSAPTVEHTVQRCTGHAQFLGCGVTINPAERFVAEGLVRLVAQSCRVPQPWVTSGDNYC